MKHMIYLVLAVAVVACGGDDDAEECEEHATTADCEDAAETHCDAAEVLQGCAPPWQGGALEHPDGYEACCPELCGCILDELPQCSGVAVYWGLCDCTNG